MLITWTMIWVAVAAVPLSAAWNSTVRADSRSGRLVRTVEISPREVPSRSVSAASRVASERIAPPPPTPESVALTTTRRTELRDEIRRMASESAARHEVDPDLVEAVIQVESNYNPAAISPKGAMGVMQLIPATAQRFGVQNPLDPRDNIEGGVRYLKYLQGLYGDNRLALAAYNAGEGAVARYGWIPPYRETQSYVYEVGRRYGTMRRTRIPAGGSSAPGRRLSQTMDDQGRLHIRYEPQP